MLPRCAPSGPHAPRPNGASRPVFQVVEHNSGGNTDNVGVDILVLRVVDAHEIIFPEEKEKMRSCFFHLQVFVQFAIGNYSGK